jgi:hypothetical protein
MRIGRIPRPLGRDEAEWDRRVVHLASKLSAVSCGELQAPDLYHSSVPRRQKWPAAGSVVK